MKTPYEEHQLAAAYWLQLKATTQVRVEWSRFKKSQNPPGLSWIPWELHNTVSAYAFICGIRQWGVKQRLFMTGEMSHKETAYQVLQL
jgi:putative NIF3 family GTP cyclohydrolase 1 type 2